MRMHQGFFEICRSFVQYYRKLPENRKLLETAGDDEICVF
jgi:hypothetical protein